MIRGQTPHFDLICSSTFTSILNLLLLLIIDRNEIINANNISQARQRCKNTDKKPNKGSEAAKVMSILKKDPKSKTPVESKGYSKII